MRRFVVLVVALAAWLSLGAFLGAFLGALPAFADGAPPPPLLPPGVSGPTPTVHATPKPGPTYVVTPGSSGSKLPAPVTARPSSAKPRPKVSSHASPAAPSRTPTPAVGHTAVASPVADTAAASSVDTSERWWMIGAAGFLLLVLSEFARLDLRGRKHPLPVR